MSAAPAETGLRAKASEPGARAAKSAPQKGDGASKSQTAGKDAPSKPALGAKLETKVEAKPAPALPNAGRDVIERLRRQRTKRLLARVAAFVLLPTLIASVYYGAIASDQFESYSQFTVHSVEARGTGIETLLGGLVGSPSRDTLVVRDYVLSRDMLSRLDREHGFIAHWKDPGIDPLSRLSADATFEEAYEDYQEKVEVTFDTNSGVLTLRVRATDAEKARQFSEAIIRYSEEMVNQLSERERQDSTRYAEKQVKESEARLVKARKALLEQQQKHAELNPQQTAGAAMTVRTTLEAELAQARAQLMQLKSYMTPTAPRVRAAEERVKALSAQIGAEKKRLVNPDKGGIAESLAEFEAAAGEKEFAEAAYRSALTMLEVARADASRQHRYLAVISPPSTPDDSTYPERGLAVLTVFIMSFLVMGIASLLIASVREHARV